MRIKDAFQVHDPDAARDMIRAHPFATIVTAGLQATHMPCLVDEDSEELAVFSHVALTDPASASLGAPLLMIFHGPCGYVSASWYASDTIPTWNHVTLHLRGTAQFLDDPMPVLRRTVDHFEAPVERPWSLDRMGDTAFEMADKVVAFRVRAEAWHLQAKLSQDKPDEERVRLLAGLEGTGAYANAELAAAMRAAT